MPIAEVIDSPVLSGRAADYQEPPRKKERRRSIRGSLPVRSNGRKRRGDAVQHLFFSKEIVTCRNISDYSCGQLLAFFCDGLASVTLAPYESPNIARLSGLGTGGPQADGRRELRAGDEQFRELRDGHGRIRHQPDYSFQNVVGFRYDGSAVNPIGSAYNPNWYYQPNFIPEYSSHSAWAVNNSGTVVGQYNNDAFYSTASGTPVTIPGCQGQGGVAYGINDNGLIVGDSDNMASTPGYAGFMYNMNTGVLTQLPFAALGVNDNGLIVGCTGGGIQQGPGPGINGVWQDAGGTIHTISTFTQANAIDSSGTYVCGVQETSSGALVPELYNTVTGTTVQVAASGNSYANAVNSSGVVVGSTNATVPSLSDTNAFVYAGGTSYYVGDLTLAAARPTSFGRSQQRSTTPGKSLCRESSEAGRASRRRLSSTPLCPATPTSTARWTSTT